VKKPYSESFKAKMLQKMLSGRSATALAVETGVPQPTLSRWQREARTVRSVAGRKRRQHVERAPRRPEDWTPEEKLQVVLEARRLSEHDLGELLRRKGLHEAQLREWERASMEALSGGRKPAGKTVETRRIRELERELRRKDKALAEAAALLVLRKKLAALWEDEDGSTGPKTDDESST
jgi:transposase